jgi:adenylate cyclase class 2
MQFEVEQKFAVNDVAALIERLGVIGVSLGPPVEQRDNYFNHPSRDFAQTDEAFRLRLSGTKSFITYKGPKVDAETKTRRELELPLPEGAAFNSSWPELLLALGFRSVAEVRKQRRAGRQRHGAFEVEFVLDEVEHVGTYCEIELQASESELDAAKKTLREIAVQLSLGAPERRSYLELLLERQRQ